MQVFFIYLVCSHKFLYYVFMFGMKGRLIIVSLTCNIFSWFLWPLIYILTTSFIGFCLPLWCKMIWVFFVFFLLFKLFFIKMFVKLWSWKYFSTLIFAAYLRQQQSGLQVCVVNFKVLHRSRKAILPSCSIFFVFAVFALFCVQTMELYSFLLLKKFL